MFSDTKKKADAGRPKISEPTGRPGCGSLAQVLASYRANAGRLRRRILRILVPVRAPDSL